jgi:hypothetical protein
MDRGMETRLAVERLGVSLGKIETSEGVNLCRDD